MTPDGHLRGADDCVVFGPGADVAGQCDDAVLGVRAYVAAVGDQGRAVQGLLDVQVDIDRVGGVGDVDVILDVADADQAGDGGLGGGALWQRHLQVVVHAGYPDDPAARPLLPPDTADSLARCR